MNKTKIDWCDSSWNPVTGCLHPCEYCYARKIAQRFGGWNFSSGMIRVNVSNDKTYIKTTTENFRNVDCDVCETDGKKTACLESAYLIERGNKITKAPYPFGFLPTFHKYRLNEPQKLKKPSTIFVGSMTDLFGDWVPNEWITDVMKACYKAPQHRYLFLTKNPERYDKFFEEETPFWNEIAEKDLYPEEWMSSYDHMYFGASVTNQAQLEKVYECGDVDFLSIEPLLEEIEPETYFSYDCRYHQHEVAKYKWVIIGSETGNRKGKVVPKREWIEKIVDECRTYKIPVFMKSSLTDIWSEPLLQEFPWRTENEKEI